LIYEFIDLWHFWCWCRYWSNVSFVVLHLLHSFCLRKKKSSNWNWCLCRQKSSNAKVRQIVLGPVYTWRTLTGVNLINNWTQYSFWQCNQGTEPELH